MPKRPDPMGRKARTVRDPWRGVLNPCPRRPIGQPGWCGVTVPRGVSVSPETSLSEDDLRGIVWQVWTAYLHCTPEVEEARS